MPLPSQLDQVEQLANGVLAEVTHPGKDIRMIPFPPDQWHAAMVIVNSTWLKNLLAEARAEGRQSARGGGY